MYVLAILFFTNPDVDMVIFGPVCSKRGNVGPVPAPMARELFALFVP